MVRAKWRSRQTPYRTLETRRSIVVRHGAASTGQGNSQEISASTAQGRCDPILMALDLARLIFYSPQAAVQATRLHLAARKYGFLMVGKHHISLHVFFFKFYIHLVIFGRLIDDNTYVHGKFNIDVTPPPLPSVARYVPAACQVNLMKNGP